MTDDAAASAATAVLTRAQALAAGTTGAPVSSTDVASLAAAVEKLTGGVAAVSPSAAQTTNAALAVLSRVAALASAGDAVSLAFLATATQKVAGSGGVADIAAALTSALSAVDDAKTLAAASATVPGLMSSTDKAKLDGIAGGATRTPLSDGAATAPGPAAAGTSAAASRADHVHPPPTAIAGNAATATKLASARTVSITGDATASGVSFDGAADIQLSLSLVNSGVTAGTYNASPTSVTPFTLDAKGRVTAVGAPVAIASASWNRGPAAPQNPFDGMTWIDTSTTGKAVAKVYADETGWSPLWALDLTTGVATPTTLPPIFATFDTPGLISSAQVSALFPLVRPRAHVLAPAPILTKTGAATLSLIAGVTVIVGGVARMYSTATAVSMPSMTAGADYFVHALSDGSFVATADIAPPSGYSVDTSRLIGGFHYGLGSSIVPASIWDLGFRPACADPRGMVLLPGGGVWGDIYLLNTDPATNGTSKTARTIADGASPPKIPIAFGGNGSMAYTTFTWYEAAEVLRAFGKRLPNHAEYSAAAYGATEASSCGTDPVSTGRTSGYTSAIGIEQASGCLWIWGRETSHFPSPSVSWAWLTGKTNGRGSVYASNDPGLVAAVFGGDWGSGSSSGSRASDWLCAPWNSGASVGARGFCDHLNLGPAA